MLALLKHVLDYELMGEGIRVQFDVERKKSSKLSCGNQDSASAPASPFLFRSSLSAETFKFRPRLNSHESLDALINGLQLVKLLALRLGLFLSWNTSIYI